MSKTDQQIYQIKITLHGSQPPIWRRLKVSSQTKLPRMHDIIQGAMGWEDSHLHQFIVDDVYYSLPFEGMDTHDERKVKLSDIVDEKGFAFVYEYDFGDSWEHLIEIEDILPFDRSEKVPICLAGERACPPEDVGGIWGYEDFLDAVKDSKHPEHEHYKEWVGEDFDPESFDLDATNEMLDDLS